MDNYKLGDLPEALRAWAKFRPADILDFKRRAKNLSLVLELPLQKTQDAFALACGYSGRHEIQQVLAQPGTPGPYDDDIPTEILDQVDEAQSIVQFYRHARLLSAVDALARATPKRYFKNTDTTVCDMDLFSTPARHRVSAKAVIEFLAGDGSGCTFDGFPYGYRGTVHQRRNWLEQMRFDEAALQELVCGWTKANSAERRLFDPREQHRAQLRYRAPLLFAEMAKTTAAELIAEPHDFHLELDFDCNSDFSQLLLEDVDHFIIWQLSDAGADDEEFEQLQAALRSPTRELIAASPIASSIDNFAALVPRWRLSLRYQWAEALSDPQYRSWGEGEALSTLILESHMREGGFGEPAIPGVPVRWLSICMEKQYMPLDQVRWRATGTLMLQESSDAPWTAVALLTGDHIIATNEGTYADPSEVAMYHDDVGDSRLQEVWKLLSKLYIPVAGYLSYHEWVNYLWEGGGIVSVLDPWVAPAHRGSNVSRWLLEGYSRAFDDGTGYCTDYDWKNLVDPRYDDMDEMGDEEDTGIMGPGVMFIPLPGSGMLGYSVWDADRDEPTTKVLRHNGQRMGVRTRWGRSEPLKGGLGPRLMDVAKSIEADIVLFDPHDPGDDNDE